MIMRAKVGMGGRGGVGDIPSAVDAANTQFIPFSPTNGPEPNPHDSGRLFLANEVKRRHGYYQDLVSCPGEAGSLYQVGYTSWLQDGAVMDKSHAWADMENAELFGILTPVAIVLGLGWMFLKK